MKLGFLQKEVLNIGLTSVVAEVVDMNTSSRLDLRASDLLSLMQDPGMSSLKELTCCLHLQTKEQLHTYHDSMNAELLKK
jgi:hypothetical protein